MSDRLHAETDTWATRPMGPSTTPNPSATTEVGVPERLGGFQLLKPLGQGGMGVVYLAEDTQLGRKAAVKVMRPETSTYDPRSYERFLREARAAAAIRHPNVVTVYQVGEEHGVPFLAMELLRGTSLAGYLEKNRAPSVGSACRLGREIAEGLAAAHEKGLVHRDIKPGNIWLEAPNGRVKLLDFGLARSADPEGPAPEKLTSTGLVVGTPGYMSPEQARGIPLDERTDLFSLGVVLYLLCTGTEPFTGPNATAVLTALAVDRQKPACELNPNVPAALSDLIDKLLEKKPEDRPQTARDVAKALRLIERGQVATPTPPAPVPAAANAPTYAMAQPTQPAALGRPTDSPKPARRPKSVRRKVQKPKRRPAVWAVVAVACLLPTLLGAAWLMARDEKPKETKTPATKPAEPKLDVKPAEVKPATEIKPEPPPGFLPPPPKGPLLPGMPGYGPPPPGGPGSPGFGPPPRPFPPPKD